MAVKFYCPKCEKRFIDWGAEKLDFKCPDCEEEKLLEVGLVDGDTSKKRPSLKRKSKAKAKKKKAKAKTKTKPKTKTKAKAKAAASDDSIGKEGSDTEGLTIVDEADLESDKAADSD